MRVRALRDEMVFPFPLYFLHRLFLKLYGKVVRGVSFVFGKKKEKEKNKEGRMSLY